MIAVIKKLYSLEKIAFWGMTAQLTKVISGPLTLIIISDKLSSEELSFYYTFFNIIALQQILELGIGFTIKQHIAHDYVTNNGVWEYASKIKIYNYFCFSLMWYFAISILMIFGIGFFGEYFFSSYTGNVNWSDPWWLMVIVLSVANIFTPMQFLVDGCQHQSTLFKARVVSSLLSSLVLWFFLIKGANLYSIAFSILAANIILYLFLYKTIILLITPFSAISQNLSVILETAKHIWPMLSKISLTWIFGYFFWNSFNLIAFKLLPIDLAGKFAFTLALAMAGYSIAESILHSNLTVFAAEIAKNKINETNVKFKRYLLVSISTLIAGYSLFLTAQYFFPDLFIFNKVLMIKDTIWIFIYFLLLFPVTAQANFCRCFKSEPYFYISLYCNISAPFVFYLIISYYGSADFYLLIPNSILIILWSYRTYSNVINTRKSFT